MVKVTVMGVEVEIPEDVAREIKAFKEECEKYGGRVQIRTSMYGAPGVRPEQIMLVCWGASGAVPSKYLSVPKDVLEKLMIIIKGRARVYDLLRELVR